MRRTRLEPCPCLHDRREEEQRSLLFLTTVQWQKSSRALEYLNSKSFSFWFHSLLFCFYYPPLVGLDFVDFSQQEKRNQNVLLNPQNYHLLI
jgi:hypothetical protein